MMSRAVMGHGGREQGSDEKAVRSKALRVLGSDGTSSEGDRELGSGQ